MKNKYDIKAFEKLLTEHKEKIEPYSLPKEKSIDLFTIDFLFNELHRSPCYYHDNEFFYDDDFSDLMRQANAVIKDEKETGQRRAEAYVIIFQLLETQYKLVPKLLEKALVLHPDMPQALTMMGWFHLRINDKVKALTYFNKAIEADPSFPYSWLQKAYLENDNEKKLHLLNEFIKLRPDSILGYKERLWLFEFDYFIFEDLVKTKKLKHIKLDIQRSIDNYSELIRLDPANYEYYEDRAKLYIWISKIDFMLSDDDDKFPGINYNAVKDMEKLIPLLQYDSIDRLITIISNLLNGLPNETVVKYIERINGDFSPETDAYWIVQLLYASIVYYYQREYLKPIEIYTNTINSVKEETSLQIQCYCYCQRSKVYLSIFEYEKALDDNAMYKKMATSMTDKQSSYWEANLHSAMEDRIEIYKKMFDFNGLINEYTNILETYKNNNCHQWLIIDSYMKRAQIYRANNDLEKALADYSAVIELGVNGHDYTVKKAYTARMEINKILGKTDKVSADFKEMSELNEEEINEFSTPDFIVREKRKYEIIDLEG